MVQNYDFNMMMMTYLQRISWIILYILTFTTSNIQGQAELDHKITGLQIIQSGNKIVLSINNTSYNGQLSIKLDGKKLNLDLVKGIAPLDIPKSKHGALVSISSDRYKNGSMKLYHVSQRTDLSIRIRHIPLWYSIFPPLFAIVLALIFKEVIISLFVGIWSGAFIIGGLRISSLYYWMVSFFDVLQKYIIETLKDTGHLSVIVFSLLIGGMVAIISKNGGMQGVVKAFSKYARSARSAQFITWLLGVAIFFDDYANTLIVGNTMRSLTDKFKISREKLAYLVDSTAAPVSSVAFITTWIGAELGFIDSGLSQIESFTMEVTPYSVFFSSLKYSFYPILTLVFILMLIYFKKDFGPMHKAETRARKTGKVKSESQEKHDEPDMEDLSPVRNAPEKWSHAALPVFTVIIMTIYGLLDTGFESSYNQLLEKGVVLTDMNWSTIWGQLSQLLSGQSGFFSKLGQIIGSSDSYIALLWASLSGLALAIIITVYNKTMSLFNTMHWVATGFKTMLPALMILVLAWALALTTESLHTADFITQLLEGAINPFMLPVVIFILAAVVSFSTGSSWSTMAILYPLAIPLTWSICMFNGLDESLSYEILLNVIATVMAASVLGDHCSPISDTTILSSLATDCNHLDHVKTQLPYALTVGTISILCVGFSTFFGGGWLVSTILLFVGFGVSYGVIWKFGKEV